jgi:hypothetical protein
VGGGDELADNLGGARVAQPQAQALLVAGVDFPVGFDPFCLPGPERVALRRFDLDDLGAEIREDLRQHIAGEEPGQV